MRTRGSTDTKNKEIYILFVQDIMREHLEGTR